MICLNMIVKDEAQIIEHTLDNLLRVVPISSWVIHDTGSQDNTPAIIKRFFAGRGIPGELRQVEWKNFGANRQMALEDASGKSEFVMFFDADCKIEGRFPTLDARIDSYFIPNTRGSTHYPVKHIVRNNGMFRWRGVVHEALYFNASVEKTDTLDTLRITNNSSGARSRDTATYYRDARLLSETALDIDDEDRDLLPRYSFYAANSWRDAGCPREAVEWYRRRIELGGWPDEVYMSQLFLGIELVKTGDHQGALAAWSDGAELCPDRAECLYKMAQLKRELKSYNMALVYAKAAMQIPNPGAGRLFVWGDVYSFWASFEFLWSLKHLGRIKEGSDALALIKSNGAPEHLLSFLNE